MENGLDGEAVSHFEPRLVHHQISFATGAPSEEQGLSPKVVQAGASHHPEP